MIEESFTNFFKESSERYLIIEQREGIIKHLTHLEELILTQQKEGVDIAVSFIDELRKVFDGNTESKIFTTIKFDGAPAIFAGYNPENNKFFVATKSVAAKTPKVNYTEEDIIANHGHAPGLVQKLKLGLKYLPLVIKQGIYGGDFMFEKSDLRVIDYDDERLVTFKPNTITYGIPVDSDLGKEITNAEIGIVFHTRYSGESLSQLSKSQDVNNSEFTKSSQVWARDAKFTDLAGTATLTKEEESLVDSNLASINKAGAVIDWTDLPNNFYQLANTYINTLIRTGDFVNDPEEAYTGFIEWYIVRMDKEIEKLKSEAGKQRKTDAKSNVINFFEANKMSIINIFYITKKLEELKSVFISKYNTAINSRQFITEPDGSLKVTTPEGYVAVDHSGNMVKLVDRLEFSRANFAISKGEKFK